MAHLVKNLHAMKENWVGKILWRRKWQPSPVLLPGEFHGQRSRAGCSPWDCRVGQDCELTFTFKARRENGSLFSPAFRCCHREFLDLGL